jgi:hypothetical protein
MQIVSKKGLRGREKKKEGLKRRQEIYKVLILISN